MIKPESLTPVAILCDMSTPKKDYELLNILCNPDNDLPVISAVGFNPADGTFELKYYNQDGTDYTGNTPVLCTKDFSYTTPLVFCHNGTDVTRTDVFQNDSNTPLFSIWQDKLGAVVAAPLAADIVAGWCTDVDYETYVLCDAGNSAKQFVRVVKFDTNIVPTTVADYELDGQTVYTAVGPITMCNPKVVEDICIFEIATDNFVEAALIDYSQNPPKLYEFGTNVERILQPTERLGRCNAIEICTETDDPELNGECGPGENVSLTLVASPDAEVLQDTSADTLCGGSWSHAPETPSAPFPIKEPLTGNTFNDANWVLNGSAMLTANGIIDAPGSGWLRLTSNANAQFGTAILNTAFPSTESVNFEFDYAVYGGSGADGISIFYLDGAFPVTGSGANGGAFGYSWNNASGQNGIPHGIVGIALDEFGTFATNNTVGVGGNNAGGNRVTVRGAGNAGTPGSNTYPFISSDAMPPGKSLLNHPRSAPLKVRGSILNEGGQLLLSVQIDFQDGDGFVAVVNRRNITAGIGGVLPPTLKIGFGGTTGGFNNFHEIKNLTVSTASKQYWRSFPITHDTVPACATEVKVCVDVDITITDDTQSTRGGDSEAEHWLRIVDIVTNETLDNKILASGPIKIDKKYTLSVCTEPIAINRIPNLRVYVGTESYDINGSYGSLWENFNVKVFAIGCPKKQHITTPISAPCPLEVIIVGGSVDSTGGGNSTTVYTAPAIDTSLVCADGAPALRYERRDADGTYTLQFYGLDGNLVTPTTWTPGSCDAIQPDSELEILCDDNRSFLRRYISGETGITVVNTDFDGTTLYTPVGTVRNCIRSGIANILADCSNVSTPVVSMGPNLLENGDFQKSSGLGATSNPGAGWTTAYTPANNIYASGVQTYAFFNTNASVVTNAAAAGVLALTGRSMAVNVGPNLATPIISWANIYLENGYQYALEADVAMLGGPFGVDIRINGAVVVAMTAPPTLNTWRKTQTVFTYAGATGYATIALHSNTAAAGGNDHCFDNFTLKRVTAARVETTTPVAYDSTVRAVIDQVLEIAGCNDARRDELLAQILNKASGSGYVTPVCANGVTLLRILTERNTIEFLGTDGAAVAAPANYTIGQCAAAANTNVTVETYRLAGNAVGVSTASTAPASNPTVGNTVTITPPFRALSWQWLRQTPHDPGDGSVAALTVNGFIYHAGNGPIYQTTGQSIQSSSGQTINTTYTLTASGLAFVEVTVIR